MQISNNMKKVLLLAVAALLIGLYINDKKQSKFLDCILSENYKIIESATGVEGVFGDVNRSWIIQVNEKESAVVNSNYWQEARPLWNENDFEEFINKKYPRYCMGVKSDKVLQFRVPYDVMNSKRNFIVRFANVETLKNSAEVNRNLLYFVYLQSD